MAINKVLVSGNLTRDAELRNIGEDKWVVNFCIAVNRTRFDKQSGQWVDAEPVFVDCAMFGARAKGIATYLTKGLKVVVEGHLKYDTWVKDDEKRSKLSVVVDEFEFGGNSKGGSKPSDEAYKPELADEDFSF